MEIVGVAASAIAITGAIATTAKIIRQLKEFSSSVASVDETVAGFTKEIQSLQTVLEAVKGSFVAADTRANGSEGMDQLWASAEKTIDDCQYTLAKLNLVFRRLGKASEGPYDAIVKQLKLDSKTHEIGTLRRHLSRYIATFQTIVSSMTLCVVLQNHHRGLNSDVLQSLDGKLSNLNEQLKLLKNCQPSEDSNIEIPKINETEGVDDELIKDDIEECISSAEDIYRAANTLSAQLSAFTSVADSEIEPGPGKSHENGSTDSMAETSESGESLSNGSETESSSPTAQNAHEESQSGISKNETTQAPQGAPPVAGVFSGFPGSRFEKSRRDRRKDRRNEHFKTHLAHERRKARSNLLREAEEYYNQGYFDVAHSRFVEVPQLPISLRNGTESTHDDETSEYTIAIWAFLSMMRCFLTKSVTRKFPSLESRLETTKAFIDIPDPKNETARESMHWKDLHLLAEVCLYSQAKELNDAEIFINTAIQKFADLYEEDKTYEDLLLTKLAILYGKGDIPRARILVTSKLLERVAEITEDFADHDSFMDRLIYSIARGNFAATYGYLRLMTLESPNALLSESEHKFLYIAAATGSLPIMELLLYQGVLIEEGEEGTTGPYPYVFTPLYMAIKCGNEHAFDLLLRNGANMKARCATMRDEFKESIYWTDQFQSSTLGYAIIESHKAIVELLLEKEVNPNIVDHWTVPALHLAISTSKNQDLVSTLLKSGADVNLEFCKVSPLALAITSCPGFLSHASRDGLETHGNNPPQPSAAEKQAQKKLLSRLIRAGADVNQPSVLDSKWMTPLQIARKFHLGDVEERLLRAGAKKPRWWMKQ